MNRKPLKRTTVRWRRRGETQVRTVTYVTPAHHEDRPAAAARNETLALDTSEYDQACQDGTAVVVSHHTEDDDG